MLGIKFAKASKSDVPGMMDVMGAVGYLEYRFKGKSSDEIRTLLEEDFSYATFLICYTPCLFGKRCHNFRKVIGYSLFGPAEKFIHGDVKFNKSYVSSGGIGVAPEYQGKGIGMRLKKYAQDAALAEGHEGFYTTVAENNVKSIRLQEKAGFTKISEFKETGRKKGVKTFLFVKKLK